jgi:hypothetical protein
MRQTTLWGVIVTCAAALSVSMMLVNFAFEAAGSVPDLEGCGFLAGSLSSLALIYPLLAAFVAARAARPLVARGADGDTVARAGAALGALGSGLYFGVGTLSVLRGSQGASVSPNLWVLAAGFVLACAWAGKLGAVVRSAETWPYILRRTEN